jgi:transcriptional regulator with XRE-family HTH domain
MLPREAQLFGAYVQLHRVRRGLSQADLAVRMGLPGPETVAALEAGTGVGALPVDVAQDLADFCGLSLDQMVGQAPLPGPRVSNRIHLHMGPWLHDLSVLPGLPAAQRDTLTRIVEELGRVLRATMGPRADGRPDERPQS